MIVSHTNRPDHFSQSPCTGPSAGWLVGWLNRFIYRANIARAPKLPTLTGYDSVSRGALVSRYFLTRIVLHPPGWGQSANERRPYMAAGGGMVYCTQNKALRRKKIIP